MRRPGIRTSARTAILAVLVLTLWPTSARADLLFDPFFAWTRNRDTERWLTGGGISIDWARGWVIAGGDLGYAGAFFDPADDASDLIESSYVLTISGHGGVTLPKEGENRILPYATGGFGVLRQQARDREGLINVTRNDPSINFGAGVRVLLTNYLGIGADLRYFHSLRDPFQSPDPLVADIERLSFWRFGVGAVIRIGE